MEFLGFLANMPQLTLTTLHYTTLLTCHTLHCTAGQCYVVQCSLMQWSTVHCSEVYCSVVQCTALYCSAVKCSAVYYSAVKFSVVYCCVVHYTALYTVHCTLHCSAVKHRSVQYIVFLVIFPACSNFLPSLQQSSCSLQQSGLLDHAVEGVFCLPARHWSPNVT